MKDIPGYSSFAKVEPIHKGWSSDQKYYIETVHGEKLLLRVADSAAFDRKKREMDRMKRISALGIPMSQPLDFGICDDGKSVFQLLTWCEGEEASVILPSLTQGEQYALGVKAGETLQKIHSLETHAKPADWSAGLNNKISGYIESYQNCGLSFDGDALLLAYVEDNRKLIEQRAHCDLCLTHGDYHTGNLVVSPEKVLHVIDFQRCGINDPYNAFVSIMFSADISPCFATGQVRGYFDGEPPTDFWPYLAFHMAATNIHALPWSIRFGQKEIDFAHHMIANVLTWYNAMQDPVPTWYLRDFAL